MNRKVLLFGILVFLVFPIITCAYAVWGYYTVAYAFDRDLGQNLNNLVRSSDMVMTQQLLNKILSNDLFNHPGTPLDILAALRPTQDATIYKYQLILEGFKRRADILVLFQQRELGNQTSLPYVEYNRYITERQQLLSDIQNEVGPRYSFYENAWMYLHYPWFFWYGPFTVALANLFTAIAYVVCVVTLSLKKHETSP
jgi:hypothetical protein